MACYSTEKTQACDKCGTFITIKKPPYNLDKPTREEHVKYQTVVLCFPLFFSFCHKSLYCESLHGKLNKSDTFKTCIALYVFCLMEDRDKIQKNLTTRKNTGGGGGGKQIDFLAHFGE